MNIALTAADAKRILSNALLFAAEDDSRPALSGVHLIVPSPERAWAVGADPYSLAYDSAELVDSRDGPGELTLPREAVEFVLREMRFCRGAQVFVRVRDESIEVGPFAFAFAPLHPAYPDFRKVIPDPEKSEPAQGVTVSPYLLQRFAKVISNDVPYMRFRTNGLLGPLDLQIGTTFRALLMPARADWKAGGVGVPPYVPTLPEPTPLSVVAVDLDETVRAEHDAAESGDGPA